MVTYSEYITVNPNFVPVYTQENDAEHQDAWMSFIPHEPLKHVLQDLIKALEGAYAADRKSIWLVGSYGTGKTYAAFVIKHLLEDDLSVVQTWFERSPLIRDLWPRFKALRERKRLLFPLFHSASSGIIGDDKLFMEIQRVIRKALQAKGFTYFGGASLYDQVMEKLSSDVFNFDAAFRKHIDVFEGTFMRSEDVIKALKDNPEDNILINNVLTVLSREHQYLDCNVDDIKRWLKDIIDGNGLDALIFIWDEFTDYFRNNAAVSSLQEIAHAAQGTTPFYFILITHRKMEQFTQLDADARKVLQARFAVNSLAMNEVTSYQLMANALESASARKTEWDNKRITLWDEVRPVLTEIRATLLPGEYKEEHFRGLVPLHPYSAFLLTTLSQQFSANQRTMFSFLQSSQGSASQPDFQWFIKRTGPDSPWKWITADYLWDYFFSNENLDFESSTLDRIAYFKNNADHLQGDALRVFKGAMLLLVLELNARGVKLLQPFKSNLDLMFRGTDLTPVQISNILTEQLEREGLLQTTELAGGQIQISMPMLNIDKQKIEEIIRSKDREWSFESCCSVNGVIPAAIKNVRIIDNPNRFAERYVLRCAVHSNAMTTLANLAGDLRSNQVGLFFLVQLESADEVRCSQFIRQKMEDTAYDRIAFFHIVYPFGTENWKRWREYKAREHYATELHDAANVRVYSDRAARVITEWTEHVCISQNRVSFGGSTRIIGDDLWRAADRFAMELFPAGMEAIMTNDNFYGTIITANSAKYGLGMSVGGMGRFDALMRRLKDDGIWDNPTVLDNIPAHPLARARKTISQILEQAGPKSVKLTDIWGILLDRPFGYLTVQMACVLLGYLFKEYINKGYYIFDGSNTSPLGAEGIASAIENLLRGRGQSYSISQMKQEHIFLCKQLANLFRLSDDQSNTLQELRKNIRIKISELRYPLWLVAIGEDIPPKQDEFFLALSNFINQEDEVKQVQCADTLSTLIRDNPRIISDAEAALQADNFSAAMSRYLESKAPNAVAYLLSLNYDKPQIRDVFRSRVAQDGYWLWDREKFDAELDSFEQETYLVRMLSPLLSEPVGTISLLKQELLRLLGKLRIPVWLIEEQHPSYGTLLLRLLRYSRDQILENPQSMKQAYEGHIDKLCDIIRGELEILDNYVRNQYQIQLSWQILRDELFEKLPPYCIELDKEGYTSTVERILSAMTTAQKYEKLLALWTEATDSPSPSVCSANIGLPVVWLPVLSGEEGRELIAMLDGKRPQELRDIERLILWVQQHNEKLKLQVHDKTLHETIWLRDIVDPYSIIVPQAVTLDEIRKNLPRLFGEEIHQWAFRKAEIRKTVHALLKSLYKEALCPSLCEKIDRTDAETCKCHLKRLVMESEIVGLFILISLLKEANAGDTNHC